MTFLKPKAWAAVLVCCAAAVAPGVSRAAATPTARIAIILDDIGYNRSRGEQALQLPPEVTFSVIPFTPHSKALAQKAHAQQREVLLPLPMESADHDRRLDDGGLTGQQPEAEIRARVNAAIAAVPHAIGLNNHMGSGLTTDSRRMGWVMEEVRRTPLFFIDSMTSAESVAGSTARRLQIPSIRRDIFLDNQPDAAAIDSAFRLLLQKARRDGYAVAIGHPHTATLRYLAQTLPRLAAQGVELVPVSHLARQYGRALDPPGQWQDLLQLIIAMPAPTSSRLDFSR